MQRTTGYAQAKTQKAPDLDIYTDEGRKKAYLEALKLVKSSDNKDRIDSHAFGGKKADVPLEQAKQAYKKTLGITSDDALADTIFTDALLSCRKGKTADRVRQRIAEDVFYDKPAHLKAFNELKRMHDGLGKSPDSSNFRDSQMDLLLGDPTSALRGLSKYNYQHGGRVNPVIADEGSLLVRDGLADELGGPYTLADAKENIGFIKAKADKGINRSAKGRMSRLRDLTHGGKYQEAAEQADGLIFDTTQVGELTEGPNLLRMAKIAAELRRQSQK